MRALPITVTCACGASGPLSAVSPAVAGPAVTSTAARLVLPLRRAGVPHRRLGPVRGRPPAGGGQAVRMGRSPRGARHLRRAGFRPADGTVRDPRAARRILRRHLAALPPQAARRLRAPPRVAALSLWGGPSCGAPATIVRAQWA